MKGLILKELYTLNSYLKSVVIIMVFFLVFAFMGEYELPLVMLSVYSSLAATSALSYDENSHWDEYQIILPISRKKLVASKYILFFIFVLSNIAIDMVYVLVVCVLDKTAVFSELISVIFASILTTSFLSATTFPLIYKFGASKISLYLVLIGFLPVTIILIINKVFNFQNFIQPIINFLDKLESDGFLWVLGLAAILTSILLMLVSCFVSLKIFKNKEF